jgi:CubicO group peptidase (beta-lactamase class C family)
MTVYIQTFLISLFTILSLHGQVTYFPDAGSWQERSPEEADIDRMKLQQAIEFAQTTEYQGSKDLRIAILEGFKREPYHQILGPTKKRGGAAGMIIKDGYLVASWGDTKRVDMTFSVTKSYLSTMAGLAVDEGLIRSVDDQVNEYVWTEHFWGSHNSQITWRHLLEQNSDWYGQLWGGYDWADRPPQEGDVNDWRARELRTPGTHFEYNDVRVNLLAYSLLQVWRKPLPMVLKENIMDPIGASTTWRWYGYENSWVNIDGVQMQSVSGGGHSGGGIFISAEDHARFGLLFLNNGKWKDRQLVSPAWIQLATTPSKPERNYGFMWWLDADDDSRMSQISDQAYYAAGFGGNYIIIEPEYNLVVVLRWTEPGRTNEFLEKLYKAF